MQTCIRQVSWLSGLGYLPAFPPHLKGSGMLGKQLAEYSCGGSFGLAFIVKKCAPDSLLSEHSIKHSEPYDCTITQHKVSINQIKHNMLYLFTSYTQPIVFEYDIFFNDS